MERLIAMQVKYMGDGADDHRRVIGNRVDHLPRAVVVDKQTGSIWLSKTWCGHLERDRVRAGLCAERLPLVQQDSSARSTREPARAARPRALLGCLALPRFLLAEFLLDLAKWDRRDALELLLIGEDE